LRAGRGEYRVRYRVDEENRVVLVLDVGHRREKYRA
jgi:mRNA-degrading endonuclease RelE of RelBE toxin-antitoxin system